MSKTRLMSKIGSLQINILHYSRSNAYSEVRYLKMTVQGKK